MALRCEAKVTIDGEELTDDQVSSLRVALSCFIRDLEMATRRKGDISAALATLSRCRQVHRKMDDAKIAWRLE